jgi:hypothetical protein
MVRAEVRMGIATWQRRVRMLVACGLVLGAAQLAEAQSAIYGLAGPAGVSGFFRSSRAVHAAGGGDIVLAGPLAVSGEFGGFANASSILWVTSVNGTIVLSGVGRLAPFLTSGYTRMGSGEGAFNAWNVGGGVNVWFGDRVGVRADVRDHIRPDSRGKVQYWTVRGGVVFRLG